MYTKYSPFLRACHAYTIALSLCIFKDQLSRLSLVNLCMCYIDVQCVQYVYSVCV